MRKMVNFLLRCICAVSLVFTVPGCGTRNHTAAPDEEPVYIPEYAAGFSIGSYGGESTVLTVFNPWQGARDIEKKIFLSRGGEQPPSGFPGITVEAPLKNVVCMSSTHIAYIDAIEKQDAVKGVSGIDYIYNPVMRERYSEGSIADVGYDIYVNYELMTSLRPDLVLLYGVAGENMLESKLVELGIKVAYIGDYVENSPLGKAEWVMAFGEMFDKREDASGVFGRVRDGYCEVRELVAERAADLRKPVVMLNAPYADTWFVPGDRSYMVRLIEDAGGVYACAGDDSERSRPLSGESAFIHANRSDIWLNPGQVSTIGELKALNPKFGNILSVRDCRVYNCTARNTPGGGSDFWESGALNADIVLKDMVRMFHPEILPDWDFYYFRQLDGYSL